MCALRARRLLGLLVAAALIFNLLGCAASGYVDPAPRNRAPGAATSDVSPADSNYRGDMDGDGVAGVTDAIAIMRIIVGLEPDLRRADSDGDGETAVNDAIVVLRCVVGLAAWPLGLLSGVQLVFSEDPLAPAPEDTTVTVGGSASVTPDAGGNADVEPPTDATSTVFVADATTGDPLLMAVVPPSAGTAQSGGSVEVSPASTVKALLFFRLGGWLIPPDRHADFMALVDAEGSVADLIAEFEQAYADNAHALGTVGTDEDLSEALYIAASNVAYRLSDSALDDEMRRTVGLAVQEASQALPAEWSGEPEASDGIQLAFTGDTAQATNEQSLFRWAEITDENQQSLGEVLLGDAGLILGASDTPLQPNPLPEQSPLTLTVTGGLSGIEGDLDHQHLVPLGLTISLRIVIPLISCIVGVRSINNFNPQAPGFSISDTYNTGHPLVDWTLENLVFDPKHPGTSLGLPVPSLIQTLATATANGQSIDLVQVLTDWTWQTLLPAIGTGIPTLAVAIVLEFGGYLAASVVVQVLAAVTVPWLLAIIKGVMIASAIISVSPSLWDLCATRWDVEFEIVAEGGANVIISSTRGSPGGYRCAQ